MKYKTTKKEIVFESENHQDAFTLGRIFMDKGFSIRCTHYVDRSKTTITISYDELVKMLMKRCEEGKMDK